MSPRLRFADSSTAQDALIFARRAARLLDDEVRLQAAGGTLAMTSAPLAPVGLLDSTPLVIALRALRADPELVCDLVVPAASLSADPDDPAALRLPDSAVSAAWAGVSPPRSGWSETGAFPASTIAARAQWGIAAVAEAVPGDPGADAVRAVRAHVWGRPDDALDGLPLGVAFAAFTMGFIGGDESARVLRSGPWTRITFARGHVIARGPVRAGLTPVRSTGPGAP